MTKDSANKTPIAIYGKMYWPVVTLDTYLVLEDMIYDYNLACWVAYMYAEKKNLVSSPIPIPVVTLAIVILKLDGQLFVLKLVSLMVDIIVNTINIKIRIYLLFILI